MSAGREAGIDPPLQRRLVRFARQARDWTVARDKAVVEAVAAGASLREVATLVGLTHAGVARIVKRKALRYPEDVIGWSHPTDIDDTPMGEM